MKYSLYHKHDVSALQYDACRECKMDKSRCVCAMSELYMVCKIDTDSFVSALKEVFTVCKIDTNTLLSAFSELRSMYKVDTHKFVFALSVHGIRRPLVIFQST